MTSLVPLLSAALSARPIVAHSQVPPTLVGPGSSDQARGGLEAKVREIVFFHANEGRLRELRAAIDRHALDPRALRDHGRSLLHAAALSGERSVIEYLLVDGEIPIDVRVVGVGSFGAPLAKGSLAIANGHEVGFTPLMLAVRAGRFDAVTFLVHHGADVNAVAALEVSGQKVGSRRAPLHLANSWFAGDEFVRFLLANSADPNLRDWRGQTPLHFAAASARLDAIRLLAGAGADSNARDHEGNSALMVAANLGRLTAVEQLVSLGADPEIINDDGRTATDLAEAAGHDDIVSFLGSIGTDDGG